MRFWNAGKPVAHQQRAAYSERVSEPPNPPPILSPPGSVGRPLPPADGPRKPRVKLHPFSGVLVILIDWIFFGAEAATVGLALPVSCLAAFTITTTGVYLAQKHLDGDGRGESAAKAFFAGLLAGAPFPIAGTIFGALVLSLSGLSALDWKRK